MAASIENKAASEHRLCKRLTTHIAYALILFTLILIGLISGLHIGKTSILPYIGLIVAVFAMIPIFRGMQRKWEKLTQAGLSDAELDSRIRPDIMKLWVMAIAIPCLWAAAFMALTGH